MVLTEEYGFVNPTAATASIKGGATIRRASPRLSHRSMRQRVLAAHASVLQKTEYAFFHLTELTTNNNNNNNNRRRTNNSKKNTRVLSKNQLMAIITEFGPILRLSGTLPTGGVFLVEVCRAKGAGVRETTILQCVEYLVTVQHCQLNDMTNESPRSRQTALVVAAARGLSTVVAFLLSPVLFPPPPTTTTTATSTTTVVVGADPTILCTGRFRLAYATRSTIVGHDWTAWQFATAMHAAELQHGTPVRQLKGLARCIDLLAAAAATTAATTTPRAITPSPRK